MRKFISALLSVALLMSAAACAFAQAAVNAPGALPVVNEPVTLTIGIAQNASVEDFETNEMTKLLEERTGIQLDFIIYPSSEMSTKIELAIAAGGEDLPDVLFGRFSQTQIASWMDADMILPMTEYYQNLCYWMRENLKTSGSMDLDTAIKYITSYDGNQYASFYWNGAYNSETANSRLNFYLPWVEKLGLQVPKTTGELYDVLVAIRDSDPNGNGLKDEIPLTGYTGSVELFRRTIMSAFVYCQREYWTVDENGNIGVCFDNDAWRDGIRFVHMLFAEGLADPAMFTQDQSALTVTMSQETQVVGAFARISASNLSASDPNRYRYIGQDYYIGPDGIGVTAITPSVPGLAAVITRNCENPQAAFMFLDYLNSEEISVFGRFGRTELKTDEELAATREACLKFWNEEASANYPQLFYGDDTDNPEYLPLTYYRSDASKWGTLQNTWWQQAGAFILSEQTTKKYNGGPVSLETDIEKLSYENGYLNRQRLLDAVAHIDRSKVVTSLTYTEDEQEIIADYYTEIKTFVENTWAAYAVGALDIEDDKAWNDYIEQLKKMNLTACVQATQSAYNRQQGK